MPEGHDRHGKCGVTATAFVLSKPYQYTVDHLSAAAGLDVTKYGTRQDHIMEVLDKHGITNKYYCCGNHESVDNCPPLRDFMETSSQRLILSVITPTSVMNDPQHERSPLPIGHTIVTMDGFIVDQDGPYEFLGSSASNQSRFQIILKLLRETRHRMSALRRGIRDNR